MAVIRCYNYFLAEEFEFESGNYWVFI